MLNITNNFMRAARLSAFVTVAIVGLSACQSMSLPQAEGIGYREARFVEISAMHKWRKCRDDALVLDKQARAQGSPAKYLASADLITSCEADVGPDAAQVAEDERMHAYAISIEDYLKGGDISKARTNLKNFKTHFSGQDLYLTDGSSFIQSMEILLGLKSHTAAGEFALANINAEMKSELRRANYWQHH